MLRYSGSIPLMNVGSFILVHTGKFPLWACSKIRSAVRWMQFTVRRGKERRGRRVLLAESCQRELWDGVWSSRWCSAQTQFKTWLTLASGRTVLSVSHLRVGERRGSARLIWVKCILIERERGEGLPWQQSGSSVFGPLLTYSDFQERFSW